MEALPKLIAMINVNPEYASLVLTVLFLIWVLKTLLDFSLQKKYSADKELATAIHEHAARLDGMATKIGDLASKISDCKYRKHGDE